MNKIVSFLISCVPLTPTPKPWTKKEQEKALEERKKIDESNSLKAL